jgi:DNA-directed RNA polymerase subunit K/omega
MEDEDYADNIDEEKINEEDEINPDADPLDDEDEFILDDDDVEISIPENALRIADIDRMSYNKLTKYERTALIGARAQQIALGSRPRVTVPKGMSDPIEIAKKELDEVKIPLKIRRIVNENEKKYEVWDIKDLIV